MNTYRDEWYIWFITGTRTEEAKGASSFTTILPYYSPTTALLLPYYSPTTLSYIFVAHHFFHRLLWHTGDLRHTWLWNRGNAYAYGWGLKDPLVSKLPLPPSPPLSLPHNSVPRLWRQDNDIWVIRLQKRCGVRSGLYALTFARIEGKFTFPLRHTSWYRCRIACY